MSGFAVALAALALNRTTALRLPDHLRGGPLLLHASHHAQHVLAGARGRHGSWAAWRRSGC